MPEKERADEPTIVVGVDGSEGSKAALRWAAQLATLLDAPIDAVMAWQPVINYGWVVLPDDWEPQADASKVLSDTVESVFGEKTPENLRMLVVEGNPAKTLIDRSTSAKMLVVGSRGHGGFAGLLLGSVSAPCAEHGKCPVLVVHGSEGP